MSNRHVEELLRVYAAIFQDAVYAYPALIGEFEKDQIRLSEFVARRGIHAFCVDLPAVGKHFDRCLSNGAYKLSGLPLTARYSSRVPIPKFLRGLYLRVFDELGCLKEDYDVTAIIFLRQFLYAGKKADIQCSDQAIAEEIRAFLVTDSTLPIPEQFWASVAPGHSDISETYRGFAASPLYTSRVQQSGKTDLSALLANLDLVSGLVCSALGPYLYGEWSFRHGPGAVSNLRSESNKYGWTNWSERLEAVFPLADCGFHNWLAWGGHIGDRILAEKVGMDLTKVSLIGSNDPHSRLIDVPKTLTKPRLIACEPSEHQWCQQNIWHFLDRAVRESWISKFIRFRDQTRNQELCMRGSQSGRLVTVDLSAASDRVTCHLVGQLFRRNLGLLLALQASRTRFIEYRLGHDGPVLLELRKFATMGSACTFPVETIAFMTIALASVLTARGQKATLENVIRMSDEVTIFGDDIIVPEDSRELLFEALEIMDFKVNVAKSYWNGKFRESCGVDSYDGHDVSPAYWKAPYSGKPESFASTIGVSNNFYSKFMVNTSNYLASTIKGHIIPLVAVDSGVCGLKTFVVPSVPRVKTRWNGALQRAEALVPLLLAKVQKLPISDDSALLQFFSEDPSPFNHWEGGVAQRPLLKVKQRWVPSVELGFTPSEPPGGEEGRYG